MTRESRKNLRCMFLLLASINLIATLPPVGMISTNLARGNGDPAPPSVFATISNADICTAAHFIIPKGGHDLTLTSAKRFLESANFSVHDMLVMTEIKLFAVLNDYFRENDLHFNTPRIAFRQPCSEHTSEG